MAKEETYEIYFTLDSLSDFSTWEIYMPEDEAILGMDKGKSYYYEDWSKFYWEGRPSPSSIIDTFEHLKKSFKNLKDKNQVYQRVENKEEAILNLDSSVYEHLKGNIIEVIQNLKHIEDSIYNNPKGIKTTFGEFVSKIKN